MGNYQRGSYHGSHPAWRNNFNEEGNFVGIEFEVDSSSYQQVLALLPDFPEERRPLTECDGSLGNNGVEIIFPPISLSRLKRADCTFHRSIAAIKEVVEHSARTGMHMNVNTRGWSDTATQIFCAVVHHMSETHIRNLGGRRPTEYCTQFKGQPLSTYRRGSPNHYVADNKTNRIELRFPMSTCDKERIDRLVDFIERLTVFATTKTDYAVGLVQTLKEPQEGRMWYDEYIYAKYDKLVAGFYEFLNKTKKGKLVLEAIHSKRSEAPEPEEMEEEVDYYWGDDEE